MHFCLFELVGLLDDLEDALVLVGRHRLRLLPLVQVGGLHRPAGVQPGNKRRSNQSVFYLILSSGQSKAKIRQTYEFQVLLSLSLIDLAHLDIL